MKKINKGAIKTKILLEYEKQGLTKTTYMNIHKYIGEKNQKTGKCSFDCKKSFKRTEWALRKGCIYDKNISSYIELCSSCHKIYDYRQDVASNMSVIMKQRYQEVGYVSPLPSMLGKRLGNHPIAKAIIKLDKNTLEELEHFSCIREATIKYGYKESTLSECLNGRNKTSHGYKWKYKK